MKRYVAVGIILVGFLALRPPRPLLNVLKRVEPSPAAGELLVETYACQHCHRIEGKGGLLGPNLEGITASPQDPAHVTLRLWLRNPKAVKPDTAMPNLRLSDSEIEAIIQYLESIDQQDAGVPE